MGSHLGVNTVQCVQNVQSMKSGDDPGKVVPSMEAISGRVGDRDSGLAESSAKPDTLALAV